MKSILYLLILLCLLSCSKKSNDKIKIISEISLNIPEPSGITLSDDKKFLLIVSDNNSQVYLTTFNGTILNKIKINAEDLEGITTIDDSTIAIVSEKNNEIIFLAFSGKEFLRHKITNNAIFNNGLEGIAFNKKTDVFIIVNEKNPTEVIKLDKNLNELSRVHINFAKDISDLTFVENTNEYWFLSDESRTIFVCDTNFTLKRKYSVNVEQLEGLAFDEGSNKIFLASDKLEKLIICKLN